MNKICRFSEVDIKCFKTQTHCLLAQVERAHAQEYAAIPCCSFNLCKNLSFSKTNMQIKQRFQTKCLRKQNWCKIEQLYCFGDSM